jgi:hypothetical protein
MRGLVLTGRLNDLSGQLGLIPHARLDHTYGFVGCADLKPALVRCKEKSMAEPPLQRLRPPLTERFSVEAVRFRRAGREGAVSWHHGEVYAQRTVDH